MSTDNVTYQEVLVADSIANWTNKVKCASPYSIDLQQFLPATTLYVKISDNELSPTNNANAYNALITKSCYPSFYGGNQPPVSASGTRQPGDVQYLFIKNNCGTAGGNSRFADGNYPGINGSSNFFVYKFDLPDDNDDCILNASIANEFVVQISTNWETLPNGDFVDVLYSTQSLVQSPVVKLTVNLKSILEQTDDNVIYFKMSDSDNTTGNGGMVKRFWISPQKVTGNITFNPSGEEEIPLLNDVSDGCGYHTSSHFWFADLANYVEYRLNLGNDVSDYSHIIINTQSGYLWQGSPDGVNWTDLFISPDKDTPAQQITIHPLTGQLDGLGAQANPGNLMNPYYEGFSNVFFLKVSNINPTTGWGGQMQKMQINVTPPPPVPGIDTIYPVWHYFDTTTEFDSGRIGGTFYKVEGGGGQAGPSSAHPNRGNSTPGRMGMFMDAAGYVIMKYPMDINDEQGWYILQVDNQYSVELSNDGANWTTAFTPDPSLLSPSTTDLPWPNKGITNMAPYYFDLSSLLPATNIYVRLGDAVTTTGWGSLAWNALITKLGYPCFLAGGNEPDTSGLIGDQQFLFTKTSSSDRENDGRFVDATSTFSYKFDLPDDEDDCTLHARITGREFLIGVSTNYRMCYSPGTNYQFTAMDIVISNTVAYTNEALYLTVSLSNLLAETDDNEIFVYFADLSTTNGWGPNLMDFWITHHESYTQAVVNAAVEEELPFLWESTRSQVSTPLSGENSRQVLGAESFVYIFEIKDIDEAIAYNFEIENEFAIDTSTNNVDWFNIFSVSNDEAKVSVSYNPYTAGVTGPGAATSNVPSFYVEGDSQNKIYFRFRDSVSNNTTQCSVYKAWTEDAVVPEPALISILILAFAAFIKRF